MQKGAVNQVQLVLGSELDRETIKQVLTEGGFYDK